MKAILTVGVPGSGKTTWARKFQEENPGFVEAGRDTIRYKLFCDGEERNYDKYKFTRKNEKLVTDYQRAIIRLNASQGKDLIIPDTNMNKFSESLHELLEELDYEVEYVCFHCDWNTLVNRNAQRYGGVPHHILRSYWKRFNKLVGSMKHTHKKGLQTAILVDLDGTVAKFNGRSPFEWGKVSQDSLNHFVANIVKGLSQEGHYVVFLSGRDGVCFEDTKEWIEKHFPDMAFELHMRDHKDNRPDFEIKRELFFKHIEGRFNIVGAFDDRPQVVRLWHDLEIPNVMALSDQLEEF